MVALSLSPQAHHAIGLALTLYLLGFTGCYIHTVGTLLEQRDRPLQAQVPNDAPKDSPKTDQPSDGRSLPWGAATALVFRPILSELLWFRRLWRRFPAPSSPALGHDPAPPQE
ncbi:MAG: hypothetical protein AAGF75_05050 [Cyanobacteria bacterium P01_H01_bin.130]